MDPIPNPRETRLATIRTILDTTTVRSQAGLAEELAGQGIAVTQATLSRDLAALGATRIPSPAGRRYAIPEVARRIDTEAIDTILEITDTTALAVIRTAGDDGDRLACFFNQDPAMAALSTGAVGSSDTVIVALRTPYKASDLSYALRRRRATENDGPPR